jgi:CubicO group peptidase (beta-lactamase class C family)
MDKTWLRAYLKSYKTSDHSHRFLYSNIGYGLLAYLIEVKTEKSFQELVSAKLFSPLSMPDTTFSLSKEQHGRLAAGHAGDQPFFMKRNARIASWDMGEIMSPSGGVYSTANDLLRYAKSLLSTEYSPLEAFAAGITEPKGDPQAMQPSTTGWSVAESRYDHTPIIYKQGMTSGYSAYIGINRSRNIAVVVLCSSFNWKDKIGQNLLLRLSSASVPQIEAPPHASTRGSRWSSPHME